MHCTGNLLSKCIHVLCFDTPHGTELYSTRTQHEVQSPKQHCIVAVHRVTKTALLLRIGCAAGINGAGKTTQLQIIKGILEPDQGEVIKSRKNMKISHLSQEFDVDRTRTVRWVLNGQLFVTR